MRISDWSSDVCSSDLINPLADWDKSRLDAYFAEHDLPRHPLEAEGYLSIGCAPCTSVVKPGEDPRAGRWRGWDKVECGIHGSGGDERSEERRVGKEGVSTCSSRWSPDHSKNNQCVIMRK